MRRLICVLLMLLPLSACVVLCAAAASAELLRFEGRMLAVLPALGEAELASGVGVAAVD